VSTGGGGGSLIRQTVAQLAQQVHDRDDAGFEPSGSPWHGHAVFVTGAPRSGTSWLHQMLLTHPDVATGGEMHVFCEGLSAVFANFDHPDPYMHLSTWVTRSELTGLARAFVDGVFTAAQRASRPQARWVLDKTPNHAHCARLLAEVYPDATFVQIIRNPRDALGSAHDLWADWNPTLRNWAAAAADWRRTVEDCRTHLGPLRYHEVRYEDLLAEPVSELTKILEAAGLSADPDFVTAAVEFGKAPVNVRPSDQRISQAKWADLDPRAYQQIVEVAGDLMTELGYLDARSRAEILQRHATRRALRRGAGRLSGAPARAAQHARRVAGRVAALRSAQGPAEVTDIATRATSAARQGDVEALVPLLRADVELVRDDATVSGAAAVAESLCARMREATIVPFMSDDRAAAVEVTVADEPRQHHRYYVRRGRISRIVIEGGR
jgi:hypothetical protein